MQAVNKLKWHLQKRALWMNNLFLEKVFLKSRFQSSVVLSRLSGSGSLWGDARKWRHAYFKPHASFHLIYMFLCTKDWTSSTDFLCKMALAIVDQTLVVLRLESNQSLYFFYSISLGGCRILHPLSIKVYPYLYTSFMLYYNFIVQIFIVSWCEHISWNLFQRDPQIFHS